MDARLVLLDAELPVARQVERVQVGGDLAVADSPLVLLGELGLPDASAVVGTPGVLLGDITQHAVARLHRCLVTATLTSEDLPLVLLPCGDDVGRGLDDGRVGVREEVVRLLDVLDVLDQAVLRRSDDVHAGGSALERYCVGGVQYCSCHAETPSSLKCCNNGRILLFYI